MLGSFPRTRSEQLWRNQGLLEIYWSPTRGFDLAPKKANIFPHITTEIP